MANDVCESRYYFSMDGEPAGPDAPPADCPACGGTGKIAQAAGAEPEQAAQADPEAGAVVAGRVVEERVAGCWVTTWSYDAQGVLRSRVDRFVPDSPPAAAADGA
jgi:YD repeat-containing protein